VSATLVIPAVPTRSTNQMSSGKAARSGSALWRASRVLPTPPGPTSMTRRRRVRPVSRLAMVCWPLPRPMKAVRGRGNCARRHQRASVRRPPAPGTSRAPHRRDRTRTASRASVPCCGTTPAPVSHIWIVRSPMRACVANSPCVSPAVRRHSRNCWPKIVLLSTSSGATNGGGLLRVGGVVIINAAPSQVCHPGSPYRHRAYAAIRAWEGDEGQSLANYTRAQARGRASGGVASAVCARARSSITSWRTRVSSSPSRRRM